MKTITLENGKKVEISEESYNALAGAVQNKRWRAGKTNYYRFISGGDVFRHDDDYDFYDNYRYASKNYYKTKQEAERALEIFYILRKYEHEFTKEELEDKKLRKYSIKLDTEDKCIDPVLFYYTIDNNVLFKTSQDAQNCAIEIGYDDYIKYVILGGIK